MLSCIKVVATAATLSFIHTASAIPHHIRSAPTPCHYLPGDAGWPSVAEWNALNRTVGGNLIRGVPLAQPCFAPYLDLAACAIVQANWTNGDIFLDNPVNIMSPLFLNDSCNPFDAPSGTCILGDMASYAINVTSAASAAAGINFAREKNIRLSIKNTGHDYLGRSAGEGSLGLWMHNLNDISFLDYSSINYTGPAVKLGAGVQFQALYETASANGLMVVGGGCPTVGAAGGYPQGGGHGPLGASFGLGSDNVLEFEVVTADGVHRIASPTQNADLYWGLAGGGAGNLAVAISVTVKGHKNVPTVGSTFTFENTDDYTYWAAVSAWIKHLLVLDQIPNFSTYWSLTSEASSLLLATVPNTTVAEVSAAMDPLYEEFAALNVTLLANKTAVEPNFWTAYEVFDGTEHFDSNVSVGGRLVSRDVVENSLPALVNTFRTIVNDERGGALRLISVIANNLTHARVGNEPGSNAVIPAWRESLFHMTFGIGFLVTDPPEVLAQGEAVLDDWNILMRDVTPGGGTYMNEGTYTNPFWKEDYYGPTYNRLLDLKHKWDPSHVFWSNVAVGSDEKVLVNGRLCDAKSD